MRGEENKGKGKACVGDAPSDCSLAAGWHEEGGRHPRELLTPTQRR